MGIALFLLAIASGGGDEDIDVDADVDVDADADLDADVQGQFSPLKVLGWLGFGQVPLLLLLAIDFSLIGFFGWMLNVIIGESLGKIPSQIFGWAGAISLLAIVLGLFLGRWIARPIGQLFASFGEDASAGRLIGCLGKVSSADIPKHRIGQVDVVDADGNRVTISATLPDWATVIPQRRDRALVIDRLPQAYLVIAKESPDSDRWLENSPYSQLSGDRS